MPGPPRLRDLRRALARGPLGRGVRRARRRAAAVRRTRRLRPDHVDLAVSGHRLWVDPRDRRGRELVAGGGRGHQPALLALWRAAIVQVQPVLAIDVGANYGELLLDARYPVGTRAIAVEANPKVGACLRRSIAAHPDAARIELHPVLAGDEDGGDAVLRVDPRWSGSAARSLGASLGGEELDEVVRPVRTLDALVGPTDADGPPGPLVLKVDTEGAELQVLRGAVHLLAGASVVVALVEFDPDHLRRAGADPAELFALLAEVGGCWTISWEGRLAVAATAPAAACDLLVVSDLDVAVALGAPAPPPR